MARRGASCAARQECGSCVLALVPHAASAQSADYFGRLLTQQMTAKVYNIAQRHLLVAIEYLEYTRGAAAIDYGCGCAAADARHCGSIHRRGQFMFTFAIASWLNGAGAVSVGSIRFAVVRFGYACLHLDG